MVKKHKFGQKHKYMYVKNFDAPAYKNYIFLGFFLVFFDWEPLQITDSVKNQFKKLFLLLKLAMYCMYQYKVDKILKGSLDLYPSQSPSVKIQIMGGKVCLRRKGTMLLGIINKLLKTKKLLTSPSNVLPYYFK